MENETNTDERNTPEYLAQLLKDKKQIQALPSILSRHVEKLVDEEINRVRLVLFHNKTDRDPLALPDSQGPVVTLAEKIYVPVKDFPDFNFVGRILGPRGMTAKDLEKFTGCKIMVRGKGSMRDKKKEEANRGKPNWEHLNEELHVLITVEDTRNRAELKVRKAVDEIKKLLVPAPEGEDDLKKRQLMELAIINGTYRDTSKPTTSAPVATTQPTSSTLPPGFGNLELLQSKYIGAEVFQNNVPPGFGNIELFQHKLPGTEGIQNNDGAKLLPGNPLGIPAHFRSPTATPMGAPIILAPRIPTMQASSQPSVLNGAPPPLVSPTDTAGLIYNPYEYPYSISQAAVLEYPSPLDQAAAAGATPKIRRALTGVREHPYRVSLP